MVHSMPSAGAQLVAAAKRGDAKRVAEILCTLQSQDVPGELKPPLAGLPPDVVRMLESHASGG